MVNAKTGDLIWSATQTANGTGKNSVNANLYNSVVGSVTPLDRNNDGFIDHIYFADLGGQVFRADFTNAGDKTYDDKGTGTDVTSFNPVRLTRILAPQYKDTETNAKYNLRFYERPVVSIYRGDSTFNNNRLFAVVNVISGDRSSPLSKMRDITHPDRVYGILDTDITLPNSTFYGTTLTSTLESCSATDKVNICDLSDSDLQALPAADKDTGRNGVKSHKGWYYPLTRFDGYTNVKYSKGLGRLEVINSILYSSIYNPDMKYGSVEDCSAEVRGGTERQLYCLPYGVCMDETSLSGTGGFSRAGKGIQDLALGPLSASRKNLRLLIGTTTLDERASNRYNYGEGSGGLGTSTGLRNGKGEAGELAKGTSTDGVKGDGSAAEFIFNERYTLKPSQWYEVSKVAK